MSLVVVLLLSVLAYVVYTVMDSYRSMAREIREMRLMCNMAPSPKGSAEGAVTGTMTQQIVEGLEALKKLA